MDLTPWRSKRRSTTERETPEQPLATLRGEIDGVVERFFRDPWGASLTGLLPKSMGVFPQLDLTESDDDVTVRVELPGVDPNDVRIEVTGNLLTVSGEKSETSEQKRGAYHWTERQFGGFSRSVQLPAKVNPDKVEATSKDGVLTITLAKDSQAKPRRITVRNA
jgi:HSP20 family protein